MKRDFQRCLDKHIDLTEEENSLFIELFSIKPGALSGNKHPATMTSSNSIYYWSLLLLLREPINPNTLVDMKALLNKCLRGTDSTKLIELITHLQKNFAAVDLSTRGLVNLDAGT
jgi:hypothetical protein